MAKTKFSKLAEVFGRLEKISSSLATIDVLADFLPKISPAEIKISAYLLRGEMSPSYKGLETGLADKMVIKAIAKSESVKIDKVESMFKKIGDWGSVIEELRKGKKSGSLLIEEVFEKLIELAKTSGLGSQEKKIGILVELFSKSSPEEAKYIARTVLGVLRLGVGEMTFLSGLAQAFAGDKKFKKELERAYNVVSDLGEVAETVSKFGIKEIKEIKPKVGIPIRMMLAQRVKELDEVKEHIKAEVLIEDKYDGVRIQAHIKKDGEILLFSRRQESITHQFPDIIRGLKKSFKGKDAIVEGEAVAFDEKKKKIMPFQILMSRKRKHGIEEYSKKVPVHCFLFDTLYLNGKNYLEDSLKLRKEALEKSFINVGNINTAPYVITEDLSEMENCFSEAVKKETEGVMIKDYSGPYQAGARGWLWIKLKKDYIKELTDSFDLAIVGAIYGAGKRAKTYGSLLAAAYSPKENRYYSFTKIGAGFTDKDLASLPKMLDKYKLKEKSKLVETKMEVDVWFEPKIVLELSGAEITISPVHTVAKAQIQKSLPADRQGGLALRFPRFLRWREDKSAENSTTVDEIYDIYKKTNK